MFWVVLGVGNLGVMQIRQERGVRRAVALSHNLTLQSVSLSGVSAPKDKTRRGIVGRAGHIHNLWFKYSNALRVTWEVAVSTSHARRDVSQGG